MKHIFLSCLSLILLFSCNDETSTYADFAGNWELERSQNMTGMITYPPGNGQILTLSANGIYERRNADTLVYRGNFYLDTKTDCDGESKHLIFTTSEYPSEYRINREHDKLILTTSACYTDGSIAWYRRIN